MTRRDNTAVHLSHCYQGEYEGSCKYGDENCPAAAVDLERRFKEAMIAPGAFQGTDTRAVMLVMATDNTRLELQVNVRHFGGEHASVVEYEIVKNGVMIDFNGSLAVIESRWNEELVKLKLEN